MSHLPDIQCEPAPRYCFGWLLGSLSTSAHVDIPSVSQRYVRPAAPKEYNYGSWTSLKLGLGYVSISKIFKDRWYRRWIQITKDPFVNVVDPLTRGWCGHSVADSLHFLRHSHERIECLDWATWAPKAASPWGPNDFQGCPEQSAGFKWICKNEDVRW